MIRTSATQRSDGKEKSGNTMTHAHTLMYQVCIFFFSHFQLLDKPSTVSGVVPSPPRYLPSVFIAYRAQHSPEFRNSPGILRSAFPLLVDFQSSVANSRSLYRLPQKTIKIIHTNSKQYIVSLFFEIK